MMGFFFRLYRGFLRRFLLQSNQYTTASAAVKPARECSLTWMQTKAIPVSAAAENCRLAANDPDNTVWSKEKGEKDSRERKRNEELIARALENAEREQKAREE